MTTSNEDSLGYLIVFLWTSWVQTSIPETKQLFVNTNITGKKLLHNLKNLNFLKYMYDTFKFAENT